MPQAVVITRPFYDNTTAYLHRWGNEIVKIAESMSIKLVDLEQNRAKIKEFEGVIKKIKPDLILINGHGTTDEVFGQDDTSLVKVGKNEYLLKGAVVYSLSCSSAKVLGPKSKAAGSLAYIGYQEDFIFVYSEGYSTRAEQDPIAKLFLEPTQKIAISLMTDNSPTDSHQKGISEFQKNIQKALLSNSTEKYVARFLIWDMINQVCI